MEWLHAKIGRVFKGLRAIYNNAILESCFCHKDPFQNKEGAGATRISFLWGARNYNGGEGLPREKQAAWKGRALL